MTLSLLCVCRRHGQFMFDTNKSMTLILHERSWNGACCTLITCVDHRKFATHELLFTLRWVPVNVYSYTMHHKWCRAKAWTETPFSWHIMAVIDSVCTNHKGFFTMTSTTFLTIFERHQGNERQICKLCEPKSMLEQSYRFHHVAHTIRIGTTYSPYFCLSRQWPWQQQFRIPEPTRFEKKFFGWRRAGGV